jgi:glycosyltransferase involved in cell wall biosynthesis
MVVEAQMSGTPTITTDWGAFVETNPNGITGYRCRMLKDFCKALEDVKQLNPLAIHQRAKAIYDLEPTAKRYDSYFNRLSSLYGAGWYEA